MSIALRSACHNDWSLLCRARALDGTCFIVGANHAGKQRDRVHAGGSLVAGPDDTVLDRLGEDAVVASADVTDEALATAGSATLSYGLSLLGFEYRS